MSKTQQTDVPLISPEIPDRTLVDLYRRVSMARSAAGITFIAENTATVTLDFPEFCRRARSFACGLHDAGVASRRPVVVVLERNEHVLNAFWGSVLVGAIPLIAARPQHAARAAQQLGALLDQLERPVLLVDDGAAEWLDEYRRAGVSILEYGDVAGRGAGAGEDCIDALPVAQPDDVAVFANTSGTTGKPKIIPLTHRNLMTRAEAANRHCSMAGSDAALSWLPFDHIGTISDWHIRCLSSGAPVVYVDTQFVLAQPERLLRLFDEYRITQSWAPNFLFKMLADDKFSLSGAALDLSALRFWITAGELVQAGVLRAFYERYARYGLAQGCISPTFGMAEMGSGVTYFLPTATRTVGIVMADKVALVQSGVVEDAGDAADAATFVSLGTPIPCMEVRVVGADRAPVPERAIGRVQFRGTAIMAGYLGGPEVNQGVFLEDGWFDSGDLGFLQAGELYLTGREKDVVVVNGANFSCHEIEAQLESLADIDPACVAACSVSTADGGEGFAVFYSPRDLLDDMAIAQLHRKMSARLLERMGIRPTVLLPIGAAAFPRTSIGKIQRSRLRMMYDLGCFTSRVEEIRRATAQMEAASRAPRGKANKVEADIAAIWRQVLNVDHVDTGDNFFELGGHSILLIQLHARLKEQYGDWISINDLFAHPTVKAFAGLIWNRNGGGGMAAVDRKVGRRRRGANVQGDHARDVEGIAVIGIGLRFPGASTVDEFWNLLAEGKEAIRTFSDEEVRTSGVNLDWINSIDYVKAGAALADVDKFDAGFFGINARDARLMDPQHRLALEVGWEAFEVAGYDPATYDGVAAVYAGALTNTYMLNNVMPARDGLAAGGALDVMNLDSMSGFQIMITNDKDYLPTRLSYAFDMTGPSINVQTACSTTLVAVHMACQALLSGECDMALAGGASVKVPQESGYPYTDGMITAPDGHCRPFDAKASGTIFGNGVGFVVLKRLGDALDDNDHIFAVVKGSAVTNDGARKVGYTAPGVTGQTEAAHEAMSIAGVTADSIGFVEAHGTATHMGDPIEVGALSQAFRLQSQRTQFCALGSVKSNVGHLQVSSGIAGFIKAALSVHHGKIPPTLNFERPNPDISLEDSPFYVNNTLIDWPATGGPRRAGVNSLGIGGVNCHIVLEQAPPPAAAGQHGLQLMTLSAPTPEALARLAGKYVDYLDRRPDVDLAALCSTSNRGRKHFAHRFAAPALAQPALRQSLMAFVQGQAGGGFRSGNAKEAAGTTAFVFGDADTSSLDALRDLYRASPVFAETLDGVDAQFRERTGLSLWGPQDDMAAQRARAYAAYYALGRFWTALGVAPDIVAGHGVGEYAAAAHAGVFSFADGLALLGQLSGAAGIALHQPDVPFLSTRTFDIETDALAQAGYWSARGGQSSDIDRLGERLRQLGVATVVALSTQKSAAWTVLDTIAALYAHGTALHWPALTSVTRKLPLPTYPFERTRHWIDRPHRRPAAASATADHRHGIGAEALRSCGDDRLFNITVADVYRAHLVQGKPIFPGAGYIGIVCVALGDRIGPYGIVFENVEFLKMLDLALDRPIQLLVREEDDRSSARFRICTFDEREARWEQHVAGSLRLPARDEPAAAGVFPADGSAGEMLPVDGFYAACERRGIAYQPAFRRLAGLSKTANGLRAAVKAGGAGGELDPMALDGCLQAINAARGDEPSLVPLSIAYAWIGTARSEDLLDAVVLDKTRAGTSATEHDVAVRTSAGQMLAMLRGIVSVEHAGDEGAAAGKAWLSDSLYRLDWESAVPAAASDEVGIGVAELATQLDSALHMAPRAAALDAYWSGLQALNCHSRSYIGAAFAALGLPTGAGECIERRRVLAIAGPQHLRRLMKRFVDILSDDGFLEEAGDGWKITAALPTIPDGGAWLNDAQRAAVQAELQLLETCGRALPGVLAGRQDALSVLFQQGDFSLLAGMYKTSPGARRMNDLLAGAIEELVRAGRGRRIRILEIGAGTGSSSAAILERLPECGVEYVYTDISPAFLFKAKETFARHGFVQYRTLDIERPPAGQGYADGEFDIVIAANVLHATADLTRTLEHVRTIMRPDGHLLLLESLSKQAWVDVIFGQTEGWWRFTDHALRSDHALIPGADWQALLEVSGFAQSRVVRPSPQSAQALLLAQNSGARPLQSILCLAGEWSADRRQLVEALEHRGYRVEVACRRVSAHGDARIRLAADRAQLRAVLSGMVPSAAGGAPTVLCLADWFEPVAEPLGTACTNVPQRTLHAATEAVTLLQELTQAGLALSGLVVVTQGVFDAIGEGGKSLVHGPLWGVFGSAQLEYPELRCKLVDLDDGRHLATDVLAELDCRDDENRVRYQSHRREAARLERGGGPAAAATPGPYPYQLHSLGVGTLSELAFAEKTLPPLGATDVLIRVSHSAINFVDVLDALGVYPDRRPEGLGGECAGTVEAVGAAVADLRPGMSVIALAPGAFASHAVADRNLVVRCPGSMAPAEAATLPMAYLTAYWTLIRLCRIGPGQKVLIHAAAGGVGLAAVQVARMRGAQIHATASKGKWPVLRALGIEHVYDSRSLDFARQVAADTAGEGVDIVLNCLGGEFIGASLRLLKQGGQFAEIGKADRDVWTEDRFRELRPDVQLHRVDLQRECRRKSAAMRDVLEEIVRDAEQESITPLPFGVFDIRAVEDALRHVQNARHVGKIVMRHWHAGHAGHAAEKAVVPDASYLIFGGLGGLGAMTAARLAGRGAGVVVLAGRRPEQDSGFAAWKAGMGHVPGTELRYIQADVADPAQVNAAVRLANGLRPLKGVFHLAGVLDDATLESLDAERLARVMRVKVGGAWNLHAATRSMQLDHFVMFSSVAALFGSSGQANHAAANHFLDTLVRYRNKLGLSALTINWGAWAEVGQAAFPEVERKLRKQGMRMIAPADGINAFDYLLTRGCEGQVGIAPIDWHAFDPFLAQLPLYRRLRRTPVRKAVEPAHAGTEPAGRSLPALQALVRKALATVLNVAEAQVRDDAGFGDLGMDSLTSIEARNQFQKTLGIKLPASLLYDHPTPAALIRFLAAQLGIGADTDTPPPVVPAAPAGLDTAEIAKLLAMKLQKLKSE